MKIIKGFQSFRADVICILKFAKGHNSVKIIDGVMVLGLSTSSDNALYWYRATSLTSTGRVTPRIFYKVDKTPSVNFPTRTKSLLRTKSHLLNFQSG